MLLCEKRVRRWDIDGTGQEVAGILGLGVPAMFAPPYVCEGLSE